MALHLLKLKIEYYAMKREYKPKNNELRAKSGHSILCALRPRLIILCLILFAPCSMLFVFSSEAKVTGICSNCHTMHNSQGGTPMAYLDDRLTRAETPYKSLLVYSCLGCHSSNVAGTWQDAITKAPIVFNTGAPTYGNKGLSAGNFYYVSISTDNTGHNIFSTNPDNTLVNTPPGGDALGAQVRCAGKYGCHGQNGSTAVIDETTAIKGAHHGDDSSIDGSTIAKSYRFLLGIIGGEDSDWEKTTSASDHNIYKGSTANDTSTISYLCAECHGNFHTWEGGSTEVGSASPWLRHPTDIALPGGSTEYAAYNTGPGGSGAYNPLVPLAYSDVSTGHDTSTGGIVACISCHRAHASPDFKMMRWDYKSWPGSGTNGCGVCHTSKS